ncbi:uncharacterized protein LOC122327494 isoform X3 [Puntigrus tetrazona]|uniref:uncharacterized protein LOC122327494 isoform X3 n=1 Tax=Puntigrus tetrazona TaxID=1606681 RepID=UPI001C8A55F1|nr:uncharacterized protein LOC122327494 isoform X3 [Puntigrus tetrazona]
MKTFLKLFVIFLVMCGVFAAEQVKEKSMMEGDSVTLNPDLTQIQRIIQMQWRFGDPGPVIAQIEEKEISYTSDKGFIDRLQLDQTGSLVIKNMKTNHSGIYKLEINTNKETLYETYRVTVYEPGLSSAAVAGIICACLILVLAATAAGVFFIYARNLK